MAYFIQAMYNLSKPVGQGLPNLADDVRLLQVMLTEYAKYGFGWAPPTPLPVDGVFSENLRQWILAFQKFVRQSGYNVTVDGKVHPMPMRGRTDWSPEIAGSLSTMYSLNAGLFRANQTVHAAVGDRLRLPSSHEALKA
jgi:hypothetical protein